MSEVARNVRDMAEATVPGPAAGPDSEASGPGIAQAHDRYFRNALQSSAEQTSLIGALFPTLAPHLDVDGLCPLDGTFVDDDLTQRQSDVALCVRLAGRDVIVYVLVEHQRTVDPLMALRMLRYQGRVWDRYVRQHPGATALPAILPAVVYQGRRPWTAATELRDLLHLDAETAAGLGEYLPRMSYRLDDLTLVDVDTLRSRPLTPLLRSVLLLMRVPDSPDVLGFLYSVTDDLAEVATGPHGLDRLFAAFTYIVNVSDVSADQLQPFARQLGPVAQEALMTTAEKLRAEGEARGRALGEAGLLLEQLTVKFGPQDNAVEARVRTATSDQLHTWGRRILTATSVDGVLG